MSRDTVSGNIERVLIAVDGSHCSRVAARVGLGLAQRSGATAHTLYVLEAGEMSEDTSRRAERDRGREALDDVGEQAMEIGAVVRTETRSGDPATEVTDAARSIDADFIVVGRHGRRGLGERLLGSVTDRVLRHADVPVVVVPGNSLESLDEDPEFHRLLACSDGSEAAASALEPTASVALAAESTVDVLGVVEDSELERVLVRSGDDEPSESLRPALDRFAEGLTEAGVDEVRTVIRHGVPHEEISTYVTEASISVVVLGSRGETSLGGQLIGSVTDKVLRVVAVPVIVVPVR